MPSALHYDDLEMNRVDGVFNEMGEVLVTLPSNHASALISFVETVLIVQSWSKDRTPFLARLMPLAKGLLVTLRVTIRHPRLFDLGQIIVLKSNHSRTWENLHLMVTSCSDLRDEYTTV